MGLRKEVAANNLQSNPHTVPLFVHCKMGQYTEGGGIPGVAVNRNADNRKFSMQTVMGAK